MMKTIHKNKLYSYSSNSLEGAYISDMSLSLTDLALLPHGHYKIIYGYVSILQPQFIIYNAQTSKILTIGSNMSSRSDTTSIVHADYILTTYNDSSSSHKTYYTTIYILSASNILNNVVETTKESLSAVLEYMGDGLSNSASYVTSTIGGATKGVKTSIGEAKKIAYGAAILGGLFITYKIIKD